MKRSSQRPERKDRGRGLIGKLYSFAREKMGEPLALRAGQGSCREGE